MCFPFVLCCYRLETRASIPVINAQKGEEPLGVFSSLYLEEASLLDSYCLPILAGNRFDRCVVASREVIPGPSHVSAIFSYQSTLLFPVGIIFDYTFAFNHCLLLFKKCGVEALQ